MTADRPISLILASASPRRHELLARAGAAFTVRAAGGVDEGRVTGTSIAVAGALARAKAEWVRDRSPGDLPVLGADTVVALDTEDGELVLGKPLDRAHAMEMLASLAGRTHRVATGIAVARRGAPTRAAVETSEVTFRALEADEIADYVASGDAEGKAGAYGIQAGGETLIAGFRGCFYNIVGLPMTAVRELLAGELDLAWSCDCARHALWRPGHRCGAVER